MSFRKQQINFKRKRNSLTITFAIVFCLPYQNNKIIWTCQFAVINCVSGVCATLHFMIKISNSRNCQQKIVYQSLNISNKPVQGYSVTTWNWESILLKKVCFLWQPSMTSYRWQTSSQSCLKCNCGRSRCFRALTGFISKLIFSMNTLSWYSLPNL